MTHMLDARVRDGLDRILEDGQGILRLEPAWVARDFLPPGRRLGLPEAAYDVGERGAICERWLASTTKADNRVGPADEGLSYIADERGLRLTLRDAVAAAGEALLGAEYAQQHPAGLGRLAKIFDYAYRLPFHVHLPPEYARRVGRTSKDEAYYFLDGVDMGAHPESFLGLHPSLATGGEDTLLPYLQAWDSDLILRHSSAQLQVPGEGFDIPSGVLHAPGTALTLELQEDSDVLAMFQALNAGRIISKDLLFKDVREEDRRQYGERFPLGFVDWELNCDPYFFEQRHLLPLPVEGGDQTGGREFWVFYNNPKFSGKRLEVSPGETYTCIDRGAYNVFVWQGEGTFGAHPVKAGDPASDELFVVHAAASEGVTVRNTGSTDLVLFTFFGPDINLDAPVLPRVPRGQ